MVRRIIIISILTFFLIEATSASAGVLCIKKRAIPVRNNRVSLARVISFERTSCPQGTTKIADFSEELADASVTTSKIADGAITESKLDAFIKNREIPLSVYSILAKNGAALDDGSDVESGVSLPDTGFPSFAFNFTVPQDYIAGTVVYIDLLWSTVDTSCSIEVRKNSFSRARAGTAHPPTTTLTGFNGLPDDVLQAGSVSKVPSVATLSIQPSNVTLQPGDSVMIGMFRFGASVKDTCSSAFRIQGIKVRY